MSNNEYEFVVIECLVCGQRNTIEKDFFVGNHYCMKCNDLTSHIEVKREKDER